MGRPAVIGKIRDYHHAPGKGIGSRRKCQFLTLFVYRCTQSSDMGLAIRRSECADTTLSMASHGAMSQPLGVESCDTTCVGVRVRIVSTQWTNDKHTSRWRVALGNAMQMTESMEVVAGNSSRISRSMSVYCVCGYIARSGCRLYRVCDYRRTQVRPPVTSIHHNSRSKPTANSSAHHRCSGRGASDTTAPGCLPVYHTDTANLHVVTRS